MLLAIDVGNTRTKVGLWDGSEWARVDAIESNSEGITALLSTLSATRAICASVVPTLNDAVSHALSPLDVYFLTASEDFHGLYSCYRPPDTLGADRFANVLGVFAQAGLMGGMSVDLGTATKIDILDEDECDDLAHLGGCIMPGVATSANALTSGTSLLPPLDLAAPKFIIGNSTMESLRSGVVLAHACAIDEWIRRVREDGVGGGSVFVTGGFSDLIAPLCRTPMIRKPNLTLDGLVEASRRLGFA